MYHHQPNYYQDPNNPDPAYQQQQPPPWEQQQQQQQHSNSAAAYYYQYPDPNLQYQQQQQQAWQDPSQSQAYPPYNPNSQPSDPYSSLPSIQTSAWDSNPSPYSDPAAAAPYQPTVESRALQPPPAYDPAQRPMSWPSSPQDYQNYYTSSSFPIPPAQQHQPTIISVTTTTPATTTSWPGHHSHSHHHSISGPLGLPNIPSNQPYRPNNDLALKDAEGIRDAFGVGGLHHTPVINIIANRTPAHLEELLNSYKNLTGHDLLATLKDTSRANKLNHLIDSNSKHFNTAATAILLGPVKSEGYWVVKAVKGSGTNEALLTEAIFGRTNPELDAMKSYVRSNYFKYMEDYVRSDLSMGTKALFDMGMERSPSKEPSQLYLQPDPSRIQLDVRRIISSTSTINLFSKSPTILSQILAQNTPVYIFAVVNAYRMETGKSLRDLVSRAFFGHTKDALLYILDGAVDRAERDAKLLEDAMVGAGTRNHLLISRLIRIHWDKAYLAEVKKRYNELHKQDLVSRIRKEVRGSYRDLMIAIAESDVSPWRQ